MIKGKDVEVITFKAERDLVNLLKGIRNRSEFIRAAVLEALNNACPFCRGTGVLTPHRKQHWNELASHHGMKECKVCHEEVMVCGR